MGAQALTEILLSVALPKFNAEALRCRGPESSSDRMQSCELGHSMSEPSGKKKHSDTLNPDETCAWFFADQVRHQIEMNELPMPRTKKSQ
jgi:hypothetical protein